MVRAEKTTGASRRRRSGVANGLTVEQIDAALSEWSRLGRRAFLAKYGGRAAEHYTVATDFGEVDALALILGARGLANMDTVGPWRGDRANVAQPLRALGFHVVTVRKEIQPEIAAVEAVVHEAARGVRRTSSQGGQGFMVDPKVKLAVEAHAMERARQHYATVGQVLDTSRRESWDYEVDIDGRIWHIEVKGTTGDPVDVLLTPREVNHARSYPLVALYVVGNIEIQVGSSGEPMARGGTVSLYHPWTIGDGELRPLGFKYRLPARPFGSA